MSEKGFVRVGTQVAIPEDEEVVKRHIPVHEQKAVDERGRQRFHGAFTGGFSAGCVRLRVMCCACAHVSAGTSTQSAARKACDVRLR